MNEITHFVTDPDDRLVLLAEHLSLFRPSAGERSVPLRLEAGESWAICGPPDSGRTRLFEILSGLGTVAAGRVSYLGRPLERWSMQLVRRQIAWVRHNPWFLGRTVRQEIGGLRQKYGMPADDERGIDLLEQVAPWLAERLSAAPRSLAADEQLALDMVRRIHAGAVMLLVDELPPKAPRQRVVALLSRVEQRCAEDGLVLLLAAENPFAFNLSSSLQAALLWGGEVRLTAPLESLRLRDRPFELVRFLHDLGERKIGHA